VEAGLMDARYILFSPAEKRDEVVDERGRVV